VLTKSRWRLTKSSGGVRGLGDRSVEDNSDTCQDNGGGVTDTLLQGGWSFGLQNHRPGSFQVWTSKPSWSSGRNGRRHVTSS
jgi:hypothetical protein